MPFVPSPYSRSVPLLSSFLLLLFLGGVLFACDTNTSKTPITPQVLEEGSSWTYDIRFTASPVDSAVVDTVASATVRMHVNETDVDLGKRSDLIELELFALSAPDTIERNWYQQSPDSLVDVAYTTPRSVIGTPFSKVGDPAPQHLRRGLAGLPLLVRRHLDRLSPAQKATTDTTIRDDSRIILQTPLEEGASWTSFREPFLSTRTVAGRTSVDTRAGQFETIQIQNRLPELAPSLHWSDYYAAEGLVRRVLTDTLERRDEDGEFLGRYISREVYTLTDLQK